MKRSLKSIYTAILWPLLVMAILVSGQAFASLEDRCEEKLKSQIRLAFEKEENKATLNELLEKRIDLSFLKVSHAMLELERLKDNSPELRQAVAQRLESTQGSLDQHPQQVETLTELLDTVKSGSSRASRQRIARAINQANYNQTMQALQSFTSNLDPKFRITEQDSYLLKNLLVSFSRPGGVRRENRSLSNTLFEQMQRNFTHRNFLDNDQGFMGRVLDNQGPYEVAQQNFINTLTSEIENAIAKQSRDCQEYLNAKFESDQALQGCHGEPLQIFGNSVDLNNVADILRFVQEDLGTGPQYINDPFLRVHGMKLTMNKCELIEENGRTSIRLEMNARNLQSCQVSGCARDLWYFQDEDGRRYDLENEELTSNKVFSGEDALVIQLRDASSTGRKLTLKNQYGNRPFLESDIENLWSRDSKGNRQLNVDACRTTSEDQEEESENLLPEVTATPAPEASPAPAPEASPTPAPEASPTPAPEATSTPAPEASPTPAPEASPAPEVSPAPEASPAPASSSEDTLTLTSGDGNLSPESTPIPETQTGPGATPTTAPAPTAPPPPQANVTPIPQTEEEREQDNSPSVTEVPSEDKVIAILEGSSDKPIGEISFQWICPETHSDCLISTPEGEVPSDEDLEKHQQHFKRYDESYDVIWKYFHLEELKEEGTFTIQAKNGSDLVVTLTASEPQGTGNEKTITFTASFPEEEDQKEPEGAVYTWTCLETDVCGEEERSGKEQTFPLRTEKYQVELKVTTTDNREASAIGDVTEPSEEGAIDDSEEIGPLRIRLVEKGTAQEDEDEDKSDDDQTKTSITYTVEFPDEEDGKEPQGTKYEWSCSENVECEGLGTKRSQEFKYKTKKFKVTVKVTTEDGREAEASKSIFKTCEEDADGNCLEEIGQQRRQQGAPIAPNLGPAPVIKLRGLGTGGFR